jgi:hypothetical protein
MSIAPARPQKRVGCGLDAFIEVRRHRIQEGSVPER